MAVGRDLAVVELDVDVMLKSFMVPFKTAKLLQTMAIVKTIDDFGVVITVYNPVDYAQVSAAVTSRFEGWRHVFVDTNALMEELRYEVLWALMRGGYFSYLRMNQKARLESLLVTSNLANRIIHKRLEIFERYPKYRWMTELNRDALKLGVRYMLSIDPSFYDYMPEENK